MKQPVARLAKLVRDESVADPTGDLHLGVDLGTANIVLAVVDDKDRPIAGRTLHSTVVRDGIVVDWQGAVRAVSRLRSQLENQLDHRFTDAAVAIPPAVGEATTKIFCNVLEAAGLEAREVVDEPVAAGRALGISDAAVIDVGHGTTGVALLQDGQVLLSVDEPTGGHHMTLVLAGALGLGYDDAERIKTSGKQTDLVFGMVRPVLEKMASISARALAGHHPAEVHLVGGASSFPQAAAIFAGAIGQPVVAARHPLFVTPLGTAMSHISRSRS